MVDATSAQSKEVDRERKSAVLKHPTLPCLSRYHTINLTSGCVYECRYCYAQSFRSHPGAGRIVFYANTLELLRRELPRKRRKPELVYFSTACEPFMPNRRILGTLYGVMELLLENTVSILISTKSEIPERFLQLFARYPGMVHVQMGLTTADDRVRRLLEPNAAGVEARLRNLRALADRGISAEMRIDPLTPELTDTEASLTGLCRDAASSGVRRATASYLFLRRGTFGRLRVSLDGWSFAAVARRIYTHRIDGYCGGGSIRIPAPDYRRERYRLLKGIAEAQGIRLVLCSCKNPDLTTDCCHPRRMERPGAGAQQSLLREEGGV